MSWLVSGWPTVDHEATVCPGVYEGHWCPGWPTVDRRLTVSHRCVLVAKKAVVVLVANVITGDLASFLRGPALRGGGGLAWMTFGDPSNPAALYTFSPQIYYHGEPISVNVHVTNNTNKTVKKIKISG